MVFSNFYEETDKTNYHRWKIAGLFVLAFTLFLISLEYCNRPYTPEEIEEIISKSEKLKRVDDLCTNLPKPGESKLLFKEFSGNSFTTAISYKYQILKPSKEVFKFYNDYFAKMGWTYNGESYVSKEGNQVIVIYFVSAGDSRYSFYCAEISK